MTMQKLPSNRSFGYIFSLLLLFFCTYDFLKYDNINIYFLLSSLILFFLGLTNSKLLTPFNYVWMKFGFYLSKFLTPIILLLIYASCVLPISFLLKIFRKDILDLKFKPNINSYWKKNDDTQNISMDDQF